MDFKDQASHRLMSNMICVTTEDLKDIEIDLEKSFESILECNYCTANKLISDVIDRLSPMISKLRDAGCVVEEYEEYIEYMVSNND